MSWREEKPCDNSFVAGAVERVTDCDRARLAVGLTTEDICTDKIKYVNRRRLFFTGTLVLSRIYGFHLQSYFDSR